MDTQPNLWPTAEERKALAEQRKAAAVQVLRDNPGISDRHAAKLLGGYRQLIKNARRDHPELAAVDRIGGDGKVYPNFGVRGPRTQPEPQSESVPAEPMKPREFVSDTNIAHLTRQIVRIVEVLRTDGFADAYADADTSTRGLFQTAVISLAARADKLRKLRMAKQTV